jgi:hypothetical protein
MILLWWREDIPHLSPDECDILTKPFSKEEIKGAIMQIERNKAFGPDGFPSESYQKIWDVIKMDLMAMFIQLQTGDLSLFKLNSGVIMLLPKKEYASRIEQYRPICLLNVSFKNFTKVGTNRVTNIALTVIKPTQSAFIHGRNILEGVVVLQETIHELHRKKMNGIIF